MTIAEAEYQPYRDDPRWWAPWDQAAARSFGDPTSDYDPDGPMSWLFATSSVSEISSGGVMSNPVPLSGQAASMVAPAAQLEAFAPAVAAPSIAAAPLAGGSGLLGGTPSWSVGLGASMLLHGAVICVVMFGLTRLASPDKASDAVMTVEMAPVASAPPQPPRQTPQGPQRVEAVARPRLIDQPKIPPVPQLLVPVKADVVLPTKPDPEPDRPVMKQAAEQTTAPQAVAAPPKPDSAAPTAGASTVASNAPQTWESLLLAKLERNKRYPGAAQAQHQEDVVYVRLVIDAAGRLTSANVVRSRGFAMLDEEVVSLAHRSSPFSAPPPAEGNPVVVVVPVEFFITHHRG